MEVPAVMLSRAVEAVRSNPSVTAYAYDEHMTYILVDDAVYETDLGVAVLDAIFAAEGPLNDFVIVPDRDRLGLEQNGIALVPLDR
jgi:hypothetical protein